MSSVALKSCHSYDEASVFAQLSAAFALLGGLESLIKPNSRVLLKPNLVFNVNPDKAATTHPVMITCLCKLLQAQDCDVMVGDSPFVGKTARWFDKTNIAQSTRKAGAKVANFSKTIKRGSKTWRVVESFPVAKELDEVDYVINMPKAKTHKQITFTGAVKNHYGLIVGPTKGALHMKMQTRERFGHMLIDLMQSVKPDLQIMDGIVGMQGDGPGGGEPIDLGFIGVSACPLSLDYVTCQIMGIDPMDVPTFQVLDVRPEIEFDASNISTCGDEIRQQSCLAAKPMLINFMPNFMKKFSRFFPDLKVESTPQ